MTSLEADRPNVFFRVVWRVACRTLVHIWYDIEEILGFTFTDEPHVANVSGDFKPCFVLRRIPDVRKGLPAIVIANQQARFD